MLHEGQLERIHVYADVAKFSGADLAQLFEHTYAQVCTANTTLEFVGTGRFYDEDEIKENTRTSDNGWLAS
jgi:hypothetical protein